MTLPATSSRFAYARPESLDEALATLADHAPHARPLAGGTDLLLEMRDALAGPDILVDIGRVAALEGIEADKTGLRIGSCTSHTDLARDRLIAKYAAAMIDAALSTGGVQIQNRGTIGGNLCNAVPSLDGAPVLLALDAVAHIGSVRGRRDVPLTEFFAGPRRTVLEPDELLLEVIIPPEMLGRPVAFWKFGLRKGQALALVNAAASFSVRDGGRLSDPRVVLGAVAPTVIRAHTAEAFLAPLESGDEYKASLEQAADLAVGDASPIDDFRSSAAYRRDLIRVGTMRALNAALRMARGTAGDGA